MTEIFEAGLDQQRALFNGRRFLATPLSGLIIWFAIGLSALFLPEKQMVWILFIGTGSIIYLALFISRFTGENFIDKTKPKNTFDALFMYLVAMALLVYAIAIPFFLIDYTSLPLTIGILTGLMWLPFSWIIQHWIGILHALCRTISVTTAWYLFPDMRFVVIPFIIVVIYLITIYILEKRWREISGKN
jgi:hypothetical protein